MLSQIQLWGQRIFPPFLHSFSFIANRSIDHFEELLLELLIIQKGGCICYIQDELPSPRILQVYKIIHPTIQLVNAEDCDTFVDLIFSLVNAQKLVNQKQIWKAYLQMVDLVQSFSCC